MYLFDHNGKMHKDSKIKLIFFNANYQLANHGQTNTVTHTHMAFVDSFKL